MGAGAGGGRGGGGGAYSPPRTGGSFGQMGQMRGGGRRYGFNCGYCSSRLEATEAMGAQDGQCPTCGNNITIPILDRYGRLIDPKTRHITQNVYLRTVEKVGDRLVNKEVQNFGAQVDHGLGK